MPSTALVRPAPSSRQRRRQRIVGADLDRCIYCHGTRITREGRRYKKLEIVQLWYCHGCDRVFTPQRVKGRTYPLKIILESLMLYYRGESRASTVKRIQERFGIAVPERTLSSWLAEYRELTSYAPLRDWGRTAFRPNRIIRSVRLHHQQVYHCRIHQAKLAGVLSSSRYQRLQPIEHYLVEMAEACPNRLFQGDARASQGKAAFDLDAVEIRARRTSACQLADLVLQTVTHNKRRHDELQRFMLITDAFTVAVEVPIYLKPSDVAHLNNALGFHVPIETAVTLTGHIDVLQIRHGAIHILDYKPNANREKPIPQLMVYALAQDRWMSPIPGKDRPRYIGSWNATAMFMCALFAQPRLAAQHLEPRPVLPPGGPILAGLQLLYRTCVLLGSPDGSELDDHACVRARSALPEQQPLRRTV